MRKAIISIFKKTHRASIAVLSFFVASAAPVAAQVNTSIEGIALSDRSPEEVVVYLLSWVLGILALIGVVIVIYGGFVWMTSNGDAEKVETAKKILKNGAIGLTIVLAAWGITLYILGVLTNATGDGTTGDATPRPCTGCSVPGGGDDTFFVQSHDPTAGETDVYLCTGITVYMSDYVDESTVTNATWNVKVDGGAASGASCTANNECASALCTDSACVGETVAGEIGFGPSPTKYFDFVPDADLESGTTYIAYIDGGTSGIKSLDQTPDDGIDDSLSLSTSYYDWTFTTGTETDNIPPQVITDSEFPAHQKENVCTNTPLSFEFNESMRISTFNDDTSYLLDTAASGAPDWIDTEALDSWSFGAQMMYADARPVNQLQDNTAYSTRLYGGDADTDFAGAIQDACGNPLDGNANDVAEGATVDNYYGFDEDAGETEAPITWTTGENAECTPVIYNVQTIYSDENPSDLYGEYAGKREGESCSTNDECSSNSCTFGTCEGYGPTTLHISGLYLEPHPEVRMQGSNIWASDSLMTCFEERHLGNLQYHTTYGDNCLDNDIQSQTDIYMRTPVGAYDTPIWVTVTGEESAQSEETLLIDSPYIRSVDPQEGAVGQYITIDGDNFGYSQGNSFVLLHGINDDGTTRESLMQTPSECGDTWEPEQIVVIAPETYENSTGGEGTWQPGDQAYIQVIRVIDGVSVLHSDLQPFIFTDVTRPNLCSITPTGANAGGEGVTLKGERFRDAQGSSTVGFALGDSDGYNPTIDSWSDTDIAATTPADMIQGQYKVSVYDAVTGLNSNSVNYSIPKQDAPEVVVINTCNPDGDVYPVPNPQPGDTNACINANIGVVFDREMNVSSYTGNVYLEQYNTCAQDDACAFDSAFVPEGVLGSFMNTPWQYSYGSDTYYGFQYDVLRTINGEGTPSDYLQPNTWYQMTITDGVTSQEGVSMSEPYTLKFRSDDTTDLCALSTIRVSPSSSTQGAYWDADGDVARETYNGEGYDAECRLLSASDYSWDWRIDNTNIGYLSGGASELIDTDSSQEVYVAGNTDANEGTATVTANVEAADDDATFTVDLGYCEKSSDCTDGNPSCSESVCDEETSHCTPVVTGFTPQEGTYGTYVTVDGCWFGGKKGNIFWNSQDDAIHAETSWPNAEKCGETTWSNTQIIAEVPAQYDTNSDGLRDTDLPKQPYTIEVLTQYGASDEHTDTFNVNDTVMPGICRLDPSAAKEGNDMTAYGQNLGTEEGQASYLTDDEYDVPPNGITRVAGPISKWKDDEVRSKVAVGAITGLSAGGKEGFKVIASGGTEECSPSSICSNPKDFTVSCSRNSDCGSGCCSGSAVCQDASFCAETEGSCTEDSDCTACGVVGSCGGDGFCEPQITNLSPNSGPNGSATTIIGCYFGSHVDSAAVTFSDGGSGTVNAGFYCSDAWSNTAIVVEVPEESAVPLGTVSDVHVITADGDQSNPQAYTTTSQCSNGAPVPTEGTPVLCGLDPAYGAAAAEDGSTPGDYIDFYGERFQKPDEGHYLAHRYPDGQGGSIAGDELVYDSSTLSFSRIPFGTDTGNATVWVADAFDAPQACESNGLPFEAACTSGDDCFSGVCSNGYCTEPPKPQCADGIDNDGDGKIDYPDDPECTTAADDDEFAGGAETDPEPSACAVSECTVGTADTDCGASSGCYLSGENYCCGARPSISNIYPTNNATNVCPNVDISFAASELLTGMQNIRLERVESTAGGYTVLENEGIFEPIQDLDTFEVTIGVQDPDGLDTNALYRVTIPSAVDYGWADVLSAETFFHLVGGTQEYFFSTAENSCAPDSLRVINNETQSTGSYTFTQQSQSSAFTATVLSDDGQPLVKTDQFDWQFTWSPYYDENRCNNVAWVDLTQEQDAAGAPTTAASETQKVISGSENGEKDTLEVTATIGKAPDGWAFADGNNQVKGSMLLNTFFCEEGEVWEYADTSGWVFEEGSETITVNHQYPQNFDLVYCDTESKPTLSAPVVTVKDGADGDKGEWFLQYLFIDDENKDNAIGIRVYANSRNLSPARWYEEYVDASGGAPSQTTIDGYQAVRDGLSYYVSASNIIEDSAATDQLYNNIYLITFNQSNESVIANIANELLKFMSFNTNVSYAECDGSDKYKLVRDTKRVSDLGELASVAQEYYRANGEYPLPQSGSFGSYITEFTVSVWNSWQGALGNILGVKVPEDQYNFFYASADDTPWNVDNTPWIDETDTVQDCEPNENGNVYYDESGNCWDPVNTAFFCPANSHTYAWKRDRADANLATIYGRMEYDGSAAGTEDYLTTATIEPTLDPCDGSSNGSSECRCYNYGIMSNVADPDNGQWIDVGS